MRRKAPGRANTPERIRCLRDRTAGSGPEDRREKPETRRQCPSGRRRIRLADGSSYVRWDTVGEFLVSPDGLQVRCRQFDLASTESFQVYLLGQALSFALVNRGFEPIHATVVVVNGEAVVFLGDSGFGKSTLAAPFVSAGYPVLTDDLLILQPGTDRVLAYPGPARIKLFPKAARRFLRDAASGIRMNPDTEKLILPLDRK